MSDTGGKPKMTPDYLKLAEKIWRYMNGRYDSYGIETRHIAKMIERYIKKSEYEKSKKGTIHAE